MHQTLNMKQRVFMFLSRLKDDDMNREVADESKNNMGLSFHVNDDPNERYTFITPIDNKT